MPPDASRNSVRYDAVIDAWLGWGSLTRRVYYTAHAARRRALRDPRRGGRARARGARRFTAGAPSGHRAHIVDWSTRSRMDRRARGADLARGALRGSVAGYGGARRARGKRRRVAARRAPRGGRSRAR